MARIELGRAQWIISKAQKSMIGDSDEFYSVELDHLIQAEEWSGDFEFNADYRLHLRNRIAVLQKQADQTERKAEARMTAFWGFITSLIVALVAVAADRYFSIFSG